MKRSSILFLSLFLIPAICIFADVKLAIVTIPFSFSAEGPPKKTSGAVSYRCQGRVAELNSAQVRDHGLQAESIK